MSCLSTTYWVFLFHILQVKYGIKRPNGLSFFFIILASGCEVARSNMTGFGVGVPAYRTTMEVLSKSWYVYLRVDSIWRTFSRLFTVKKLLKLTICAKICIFFRQKTSQKESNAFWLLINILRCWRTSGQFQQLIHYLRLCCACVDVACWMWQ